MQRFSSQKLFINAYQLYFTIRYLDHGDNFPIGEMAPKVIMQLEDLRGSLEILELRFSLIHLNRMVQDLTATQTQLTVNVTTQLANLMQQVVDELNETYCIVLAPEKTALFDPSSPLFGGEVAKGFGTAAYDIEEAVSVWRCGGRPLAYRI